MNNHQIKHSSFSRDSQLTIFVADHPIGGFRGQVGTLEVRHAQNKSFKDWSSKDLDELATLENQILRIHEQSGVINTLIYGKEENGLFTMNFVPYPRCNFFEKVQGTYHTVFGAPALRPKEITSIQSFYDAAFSLFDNMNQSPVSDRERKERRLPIKQDPFCKTEIIDRQKIIDLDNYHHTNRDYSILHDHIPKGAVKTDPHLLIIPKKEEGHVDGSSVPVDQRRNLLGISQGLISLNISQTNTILLLERNGSLLRGVQHLHINIIVIQSFPKTALEKIQAVFRQLLLLCLPFLGKLSNHELDHQITKCAKHDLSKI